MSDSVDWIADLMVGSIAAATATIAIAVIGLLLFDGRLRWRQAMRAVLGCFLIFGAPAISRGITSFSEPSVRSSSPMAPHMELPAPLPRAPEQYDPYAGASVPQSW